VRMVAEIAVDHDSEWAAMTRVEESRSSVHNSWQQLCVARRLSARLPARQGLCLVAFGPVMPQLRPARPSRRGSGRRFRRPEPLRLLVGVTGFEPAASSSRTTRATKLRHTPWQCCRPEGRGDTRG